MTRKLCCIGGGSYAWMPTLLRDLYNHEELRFDEIVLQDIRLEAAQLVARYGERLNRELGRSVRYTATANLTRALEGAESIIITISTGGLEAMAKDLAIPEQYGVYHTVGDTSGPGGWARSLRNIPVFAHLGRQIARHAPGAFLLNYTNPMAVCTDVLARFVGDRVVGLCHAAFELQDVIKRILNLKHRDDVDLMTAGTNHFFWLLDFKVKGRSRYDEVRRILARKTLRRHFPETTPDPMGFRSRHYVADYLYELTHYLPYTADRHTAEFIPGCLNPSLDNLRRWKLKRTSIAARHKLRRDAQRMLERRAAGELPLAEGSQEKAAHILTAIQTGKPFHHVFNLPNRGQVSNLPMRSVLETRGAISSKGFVATKTGPLPQALANLSMPHIQMQLDLVDGFLEKDREKIEQSLLGNPLLGHLDLSEQRRLTRDLWRANSSWLPRWLRYNRHR